MSIARLSGRRKLLPCPGLLLGAFLLSWTWEATSQERIYRPYRNVGAWSADTLYLGASFARLTADPVRIWLKFNEAAMVGRLSFIHPRTGAVIPLFLNHGAWNAPIVLSSLVDIPVGVKLTFQYETLSQGTWHKPPTPEDRWPKYTGPNLPGDPYFSRASSDGHPDPNLRFGHQWSVAGRVNERLMEFGFEDRVGEPGHASDMDFDDIIFQVEGLSLVRDGRAALRRSYVW